MTARASLLLFQARLSRVTAEEALALWDALAQYVENRRDAEEEEGELDAPSLCAAERLLENLDAAFTSVEKSYAVRIDGRVRKHVSAGTGQVCHGSDRPAVAFPSTSPTRWPYARGNTRGTPPCAIAMGCYCAAHARGADAGAPCDATE